MSNLSTTERNGGNTRGGLVLNRPLSDLWGDPFRNFFSGTSQPAGMEINGTDTACRRPGLNPKT